MRSVRMPASLPFLITGTRRMFFSFRRWMASTIVVSASIVIGFGVIQSPTFVRPMAQIPRYAFFTCSFPSRSCPEPVRTTRPVSST